MPEKKNFFKQSDFDEIFKLMFCVQIREEEKNGAGFMKKFHIKLPHNIFSCRVENVFFYSRKLYSTKAVKIILRTSWMYNNDFPQKSNGTFFMIFF